MTASASLPGAERPFFEVVRSVFRDRPSTAMIEIADRCNESCVHCYQVQGQKGEMTSDDIFATLDQLAELGVLFLTISGGEPTLRSDFLDIIRHARRLDFAITLYTNGLRITDEVADELARVGLRRVDISLYSVDAEAHDWVTNVPGSWEKSVAAVQRLTSRGIPVKLKTPQMATNSGMWDAYQKLAASLGADAVMDPGIRAREDGERFPEQLRSDDAALKALLPKLQTGRRDPSFDRSRTRICGAGDNVHIEPNGELRPCTMIDVSVGDVRTDGVGAHLTSEVARTLRELRWSDLPGCSGCHLAHVCHRCHGQSLREVGDALAPYPGACHGALVRWEVATGRTVDPELKREDVVGPFEVLDDHVRAVSAEPLTAAQRELYRRQAWLRRDVKAGVPRAHPGQLVQLRRPGRRAKSERIPQPPKARALSTTEE